MSERQRSGLDDVIETRKEPKPKKVARTFTTVRCPLCSRPFQIDDRNDLEEGVGQRLGRCQSDGDSICDRALARPDNQKVFIRYQRLLGMTNETGRGSGRKDR